MATETPSTPEQLLDLAVELGDKQADELGDLRWRLRRHRRAMHRAIRLAARGQINLAISVLEEELKRDH